MGLTWGRRFKAEEEFIVFYAKLIRSHLKVIEGDGGRLILKSSHEASGNELIDTMKNKQHIKL